jgi:excisionase family DNA binding protein
VNDYLTPDEAAVRLRLPVETVLGLIRSGKLPAFSPRVGPRKEHRIHPECLDALVRGSVPEPEAAEFRIPRKKAKK